MTFRAPGGQRWWRHLGWPAVVAGLGVGGMLLGGVPAWRAVAIAAGVGATLWAVATTVNLPAVRWPVDRPTSPYRTTTSWEVPGLAAARHTPEVFETHLRPQLAAMTRTLLERRGIGPESAAVILGPDIYAALFGDEPTRVQVPGMSLAISRLATDPALPGPIPTPQPELRGLVGRRQRRTPTGRTTAGRPAAHR